MQISLPVKEGVAMNPLLSTRDRLVEAAAAEFCEHGFAGTDSNRIARKAGFAPQTFYRWFKDKTAIFLAVYRAWEDEERETIGGLLARRAEDAAVVEACVEHHRCYLLFRRSLRALSLETPGVRAARAESRRRQVAQIARWAGDGAPTPEETAVRLFELERLSDAIAEGELADMGLSEAAARRRLADIIRELRGEPDATL
jgi:AcrR family transcriptional regulator